MMLSKLFLAAYTIGSALAAPMSIFQTAQSVPDLSTLVSVLITKGYEPVLEALSGVGSFTVFAPTNEAFKAAGLNVSNVAFVTDVLEYHVLNGAFKSTDLKEAQFPHTLMRDFKYENRGSTQVVGVYKMGGKVYVNFGLPDGEFTAEVTTADVLCSNGVVHIIDKVLLLPDRVSAIAKQARLHQFVDALAIADLDFDVDYLSSLTVFAPTDKAFFKIGGAKQYTLNQLSPVVAYHVVDSGVVFSTDLTDGMVLPTQNNANLTVSIDSCGVHIVTAAGKRSRVIVPDVITANGVVHVIDEVLLPKGY